MLLAFAEDAVNDLIRFSHEPAVIVPAIVPALEAALMQMVPTVLGNAVAASMGGTNPASPSKLRKPSELTIDTAVLVARLSAIRDQLTAVVDLCNGVEPSSKRDESPTKPPMPSVPEAAPFHNNISKSPSRRPSALRRASTGGLPQTTAPPSAATAAAAAAEIAAARAAARRPSVDLPVTGGAAGGGGARGRQRQEQRGGRRGSKLGGGSDYTDQRVAPRQRQHRRPLALHPGAAAVAAACRAAAGGRASPYRRAVRASCGRRPSRLWPTRPPPTAAAAARGCSLGSARSASPVRGCPARTAHELAPAPGAVPAAPPQRRHRRRPRRHGCADRRGARRRGGTGARGAAAAAAEFGDGYGEGMRWTAAGAEAGEYYEYADAPYELSSTVGAGGYGSSESRKCSPAVPVVAPTAPSPPPSAAPASAGGRLSDAEVDAALALSGAMAPERADTYGGGYGGHGGGSASASANSRSGTTSRRTGTAYEGSGSKRGYSNYGRRAHAAVGPAAPPPPTDGWNAFDDEVHGDGVEAGGEGYRGGDGRDERRARARGQLLAHFDVGRTGLLKIPQFTELLRVVHKAEGEAVVGGDGGRSSSRRTCRTTARWTSTSSCASTACTSRCRSRGCSPRRGARVKDGWRVCCACERVELESFPPHLSVTVRL